MAITCASAPHSKSCGGLTDLTQDRRKYVQDLLNRAANSATQAGSLAGCPDAALLPHMLQRALPGLGERYAMGRELGRGHFGVVRECEEVATGQVFACKTMHWSALKVRCIASLVCCATVLQGQKSTMVMHS